MKHALLNDIELDVQELKCLVEAVSKEYNNTLCEVAKRHISQMRLRLDTLYEELTILSAEPSVEQKKAEELLVASSEVTTEVLEIVPNGQNIKTVDDSDVIVDRKNIQTVKVEETTSNVGFNRQEETRNEIITEAKQPSVHLPEEISSTVFVSDILRTNLRHSISLNDSFRFTRELFGGDSEKMNRVVKTVDEMHSLDEALLYVKNEVDLDEENDAVMDFIELLRKRFN